MSTNQIKTELAAVTERLNDILKPHNRQVKIGHRNGYTAIDLMNLNGGMINYITTEPTDKKAMEYLYAMLRGIDLVSNKNN